MCIIGNHCPHGEFPNHIPFKFKKDIKSKYVQLFAFNTFDANNVFLLTKLVNILYFDFHCENFIWTIPYFVYPMDKTSLTASIFMTLCLAHQRYVIIWIPGRYKSILALPKAKCKRTVSYIYSAITFAMAFNIPRYFCFELVQITGTNATVVYEIQETKLRKNYIFQLWYQNLCGLVFTGIVPVTLLICCNWSVYCFVQRKQQDINKILIDIEMATFFATKRVKSFSDMTVLKERRDHTALYCLLSL